MSEHYSTRCSSSSPPLTLHPRRGAHVVDPGLGVPKQGQPPRLSLVGPQGLVLPFFTNLDASVRESGAHSHRLCLFFCWLDTPTVQDRNRLPNRRGDEPPRLDPEAGKPDQGVAFLLIYFLYARTTVRRLPVQRVPSSSSRTFTRFGVMSAFR